MSTPSILDSDSCPGKEPRRIFMQHFRALYRILSLEIQRTFRTVHFTISLVILALLSQSFVPPINLLDLTTQLVHRMQSVLINRATILSRTQRCCALIGRSMSSRFGAVTILPSLFRINANPLWSCDNHILKPLNLGDD